MSDNQPGPGKGVCEREVVISHYFPVLSPSQPLALSLSPRLRTPAITQARPTTTWLRQFPIPSTDL